MHAPLGRTVFSLCLLSVVMVLACTGSRAHAGSLTPPVGPVAPTMKTLTEVEPRTPLSATNTPGDADSVYKITASGSYYLTGDVTAPAGKNAIEIDGTTATDVTLDLSGFTVRSGAAGTLQGILAEGGLNLVIRNGAITGFTDGGVYAAVEDVLIEHIVVRYTDGAGITSFSGGTIRDCHVRLAGDHGIYIDGVFTVERCTAEYSGQFGILAVGRGQIIDCIAYANAGIGIAVADQCTIRDCIALDNETTGFALSRASTLMSSISAYNAEGVSSFGQALVVDTLCMGNAVGVQVGERCTLRDVVAHSSDTQGFVAGPGSSFERCHATGGGGAGFVTVSGECVFAGCTSRGGLGDGFQVGPRTTLTQCEATSNNGDGFECGDDLVATACRAKQNTGDGFRAGVRAALTECHAATNTLDGIECGWNGRLESCTSAGNTLRGFSAGDGAQVVHCRVSDNGAEGIVVANGAHIEGNNVRSNSLAGISVNFSSRVSGNTLNGNGTAVGNQGGIVVLGRQCEITGNTLSFDDVGILVAGTRNFIGRNTAGESTVVNYSIVAGNSYGPVVNIAGVGDITGTANANHPQANYQR